MDELWIYNGVGDVGGEFSTEFRRYIQDEKLTCHYISREGWGIWAFNSFTQRLVLQLDGVDPSYLDSLNKLEELALYHCLYGLVQFWKAEEVTADGEKRFILTTRNQPFLISEGELDAPLDPKLYTYRMKMTDIVTRNAGEGGVVGRVFWNKRMEATPDIRYYSYEDYPHRDMALSCNIKGSMVVPLTDSSGRLAGVFEIVSPLNLLGNDKPILQLWNSLSYFDCWKDIRQQYNVHQGCFRKAASEIKKVMKAVGRCLNLVCAQTWMLSNNCESISTSKSIFFRADASYWCDSPTKTFRYFHYSYTLTGAKTFIELEYEYTLKKAEGVVGKAATSVHNLVYCGDVSEFCITEYPLSHFARECGLTSSFAICLQSDLTGNQIYILEFFLKTNRFNRRDLRAILVPILEIIKQNFRTFKVASGEEIGDNLSVLVIDAHSPEKIATLRNAIGTNSICEGRLPYNVLPYTIGESSTHETDDPMDGAESSFNETSSEDTTLVSASTVQCELRVTVNASFRGDFYKFQLSSSSGTHGLSQQVSRQLNLEIGSYFVKYLDEDNEWILVACDDDLHHHILSLIEKEKYTLMMKIQPKEEF